jgi:flagellar hook-associated protein 2
MSMSVDGLISGMDTTALITQLIAAEAAPQAALKTRLKTTELAASAYRTMNTTFAAVRAAAEAIDKPEAWTPTKASSSSTHVTVSSTATATAGSLTFTIDRLASAHSIFRADVTWTDPATAGAITALPVYAADGTTLKGTIAVGSGSLNDAAKAINDSSYGLTAAVVKTDTGAYALTVTAKKTGAANNFGLGAAGDFTTVNVGSDAKLTVGAAGAGYSVTSDTNTFGSFMPGVTITAAKASLGTEVTINVAADPEAVAAKMQSLIDAVNAAIKSVKDYTNNSKGSTAALKGDFSVGQLTGQLLDAVSFAVGAVTTDGQDRSPKIVGLSLSKDGKVSFNKADFLTALNDTPALAMGMVAGRAASTAPAAAAVTGIADRLLDVAKRASDNTTGTLMKLAENQDSMGKDIQARIEAWDLRLAKRKETLTRQFTAMETALSSLKNQSTWLAGQINSLPTYG